jgi:hypothetical protein
VIGDFDFRKLQGWYLKLILFLKEPLLTKVCRPKIGPSKSKKIRNFTLSSNNTCIYFTGYMYNQILLA